MGFPRDLRWGLSREAWEWTDHMTLSPFLSSSLSNPHDILLAHLLWKVMFNSSGTNAK